MQTNEQAVAEISSAAKLMADDIDMVRCLMGGTRAMRKAGVKYLPAWANEDTLKHQTRLSVSTLFPAYSRTVTTLAGKPFSKPINFGDDVPPNIKEWMEDDADMQGRNLDTFTATVLEAALAYGICGILVDVPKGKVEPGQVVTQAQEAAAGVRPYLIHVVPWNILGWKAKAINGVMTLLQLRLREFVTEEDGDFAEKEIEQIRVLEPGSWETYRKVKEKEGEWVPFESGPTSIDFIPFVPVYGQRTDFMMGKPPMLEMAHLNVKHWQSQSDQDDILHVCRVPILVVSGIDDDSFSMTIGASAAVKLPTGANAFFVEHSGGGVGAGRTSLEDLKEEMRQAGAELLVIQAAAITATQVSSENSVGMCALQRIVQGTEDALDQVLQYCALWINQAEGGHVTIFNDFGATSLAEAGAQLLLQMRLSGDLSKETLLSEIKRRGILSAEVDPAKEMEAAAADGPPLGTMGTQPNPPAGAGQGGNGNGQ